MWLKITSSWQIIQGLLNKCDNIITFESKYFIVQTGCESYNDRYELIRNCLMIGRGPITVVDDVITLYKRNMSIENPCG